jgi:hypothetical protein
VRSAECGFLSQSLLTGVLPNSPALSKVGRAVRFAPPEVAQSRAFRPFWGARGGHGVPALPAKAVGQHALTSAATLFCSRGRRIADIFGYA